MTRRAQAVLLPVGDDLYAVAAGSGARGRRRSARRPGCRPRRRWCSALFNLRGEIVPLFDTAALLGLGTLIDAPFAVVVETAAGPAGLVVERASRRLPSLDDRDRRRRSCRARSASTESTTGSPCWSTSRRCCSPHASLGGRRRRSATGRAGDERARGSTSSGRCSPRRPRSGSAGSVSSCSSSRTRSASGDLIARSSARSTP